MRKYSYLWYIQLYTIYTFLNQLYDLMSLKFIKFYLSVRNQHLEALYPMGQEKQKNNQKSTKDFKKELKIKQPETNQLTLALKYLVIRT